ncbi:MAG: gliding motility-associated C-terminal domain-containing protein [Candidatus Zixiibacteriota bacterium]
MRRTEFAYFVILICVFSVFSAAPVGETGYRLSPEDHPSPISDPELYERWKAEYATYLRGSSHESESSIRREMDHRIGNGYVAADLDETSGEFDQGGDASGGGSYVNITYSWPGSPGTEWVMYKVDGHGADKTAAGMPNTSSHSRISSTQAESIWNDYHGVRIRQVLTVQTLGASPGDNEQVKFETFITPVDGSCHDVGCIVYYDTKLNYNDGAPISTSFGYSGIATIFFAPTIPSIWRAYESGTPPAVSGLQSLGILSGFDAVMPDVFWYGRWPSSTGNGWPDSDWIADTGGGFGGDTATMVKWYQRTVCPGDTIRYCTYYGIGELTGTGLTLNHSMPEFTASCAGLSPDPAAISALITNAGSSTATGVSAELGLGGSDLVLTGAGDPSPLAIGTIAGSGGTETTNWIVDIPPSAYGTTQCYTITVNYAPSHTITETYCVDIPTPVTLDVVATADDDELCAPECTNLHAIVSGSAPGPYTYSWSPTTGLSDPSSPNPEACPTGPVTYTVTVENDDPACTDMASVTIEAGEGEPFEIPPDTICSGSSTTLTPDISPSGATYVWSNGATTPTITVSPTSTTDYWCEICIGACCSADTTTVTVSPPITVNPGVNDTICDGESIILGDSPTATGGLGSLSYIWTPAAGMSNPTLPNPEVTPTSTTTYTLTVTDEAGCSESEMVTITLDYPPESVSLVYPPDGTLELPPATINLEWDPVSDPDALYDVYIDGELYRSGLTETETDYMLSCDEEHTWHVIARNWCGEGPASATWTFNTVTSVTMPSLISPPDGDSEIPPGTITLDWEDAEGSEPITYDLFVDDTLAADDITASEFDIEVSCDDTIEWYVIAENMCAIEETEHWTFTTTITPDTVILLSPEIADTVGIGGTYLTWNRTTGTEPVVYDVIVNGDTIASDLTDTTLFFTADCDSFYDWHVIAKNICGPIESEIWTFQGPTSTEAPELLFPPDSVTAELPGTDLVWNSAPGSEPVYYQLFINGEEVAIDSFDTTYFLDVSCDSTYEWFVIANNVCGFEESEHRTIFTNDSPESLTLAYPADEDTIGVPVVDFSWNSAEGSLPIYYDLYINGEIITPPNYTDTFYTIETWCDEEYEWFVVAYNMCSADTSETWEAYGPRCGEPISTLIEPFEGSWSACDDQRILILIEDLVEIDTMSISMTVNSVEYDILSPELDFIGDTLIFTPSIMWTDGELVEYCIDSLANIYHIPLEPFCSSFRVDLSAPLVFDISPTDSVITDPTEPISMTIVDSLSGLDAASIVLTIDGTDYTIDDFEHTWLSDSTLEIDFTSHPAFMHNDTIDVCIHADDTPDYCDIHSLDSCFSFIMDTEGPYAETPIMSGSEITDGSYISCPTHGFCFTFDDSPLSWGIEPSSVELSVDGDIYALSSPEISYTGDEFCFEPETLFTDGAMIEVELVSASDIHGNPLVESFAFNYIIDISAPVLSGADPDEGAFVSELEPIIEFDLTDLYSGVYYDGVEICLTISSGSPICYTEADAGITRSGDHYTITTRELSLGLTGGNSVDVCVDAADAPDICAANELDTCWTFLIPEGGPIATYTDPSAGSYSSCADQGIYMQIRDAAGDPIDEPTIQFSVNGTVYTTADPELTFTAPDSLSWIPSSDFADGDIVNAALIACSDILGNELSDAPVERTFIIDLTPPIIGSISPTPGAEVSDLCPTLSFTLEDLLSGLDESSAAITINGTSISLSHPDVSWSGGSFSIDLCDLGMELRGGDDINVNVNASDTPDYCAANVLDTTFVFGIPDGGPVATINTPEDSIITACDPQEIRIGIEDREGDAIMDSTVELCVNSICFGLDDDELSWDSGELVFDGGAGYFTSGEVVTVELRSCSDVLFNPLENPLTWVFTPDYQPPEISFIYPGDGGAVSDISPLMSFLITDDTSGVDLTSLLVNIDGTDYLLSDIALYMSGDTVFFDPDSLAIEWAGGDVVDIEIYAQDSPTPGYCEPNDSTAVFSFSISSGGPVGNIIRPSDSSYVACNPVEIVMTLTDPEGDEIDESSIVFSVDDVDYGITDPFLSYDPITDTLRFLADEDFFADGDTIEVVLREAEDILRNELDEVRSWIFIVDYTPPVYWSEIPSDGTDTTETSPDISIHLADSLAGLDPSLIEFTIDGITYHIGDAGIHFDGEILRFSPSDLGIEWTGGDLIDIRIDGADNPDYCGPNTSSFSWDFFIPTGGPISNIIEPLDSTISACEDQNIIMTITDEDGVDASTIIFNVEGIDYTVDDPELSYSGDELVFDPPDGFYGHGDIIDVQLVEVYDNLGNFGDLLPMSWSFIMDFEGPVYSGHNPIDGSHHSGSSNWQLPISVELMDNILGIDEASIEIILGNVYRAGSITLNTSLIGVDYTALSDTTAIVEIDPSLIDETVFGISYPSTEDSLSGIYFPEFEDISIEVIAADNEPDYCGSHTTNTEWSIHIDDDDTIAPEVVLEDPEYVSTRTDFNISILATDSSGLFYEPGYEPYLIYDDDGEVDTDYDGTVTLEFDAGTDGGYWINPDGSITRRFTTTSEIPGYANVSDFVFRAFVNDGDFDFSNHDDLTQGPGMDTIPILAGPEAAIITPQNGQITACSNQQIIIRIWDIDGVDASSIVLNVDAIEYPIGHEWLSYDHETEELTFAPDDIFTNNQTVNVSITMVLDSLGNPMWDVYEYEFLVDLEAPEFSEHTPTDSLMIQNQEHTISVNIEDNLAGISPENFIFTVNDIDYYYPDAALSWDADADNMEGILSFNPVDAGRRFYAGDTIRVMVSAADDPDILSCGRNENLTEWLFVLEPKIVCSVQPNPFTPNDDGYNDIALFAFPEMFSEGSELEIYDKRKKLVYKGDMNSITRYDTEVIRQWNGTDNNNKNLRPGVYFYIIKRDGELICEGTITLIR